LEFLQWNHNFLFELSNTYAVDSVKGIITVMETSIREFEQEIQREKVNILTMHKAKGLTAEAVIVVAAEDEHIPGRQVGEVAVGDERRLLYVSLTRAKHKLFITYCQRRFGQQQRLGREGGTPRRKLTRFLVDCSIRPQRGIDYISARGNRRTGTSD